MFFGEVDGRDSGGGMYSPVQAVLIGLGLVAGGWSPLVGG